MITDDILEAMPDVPMLNPEDVSGAVLYTLGTLPHVQVIFNIIIEKTIN